MVEPQSLGGREIRFRVVDAALGSSGVVPFPSLLFEPPGRRNFFRRRQ